MKQFVADEKKLRELIVYLANACAADETFGAMKLNKLLFLSDFLAYGTHGKPITGVDYMKLENGPVPRRLLPIREEMENDGDIAIEKRQYYGMPNPQTRIIARRNADVSLLEKEEIALVDDLIRSTWGASGTKVSELTHGYRAWLMTRQIKDSIPYEAVFLSDEPPTEYEILHAEELIREHGWDV